MSVIVIANGLLLCAIIIAVYLYLTFHHPRYPPGPQPDFLIGNVRQLPLEYQEKTFAKWGHQYGMQLSYFTPIFVTVP